MESSGVELEPGFVNRTSSGRAQMLEKALVTLMEPDLRSDAILWREVEVEKHLWRCMECGLVWQMRHEAENCSKRGHKPSYVRGYGGRVENGVYQPAATYTFHAVRRDPIPRSPRDE